MKNTGIYYIIVIEDTHSTKIIGSATLISEQKFIHNCALVCMTFLIGYCIIRICTIISLYVHKIFLLAWTFGRCSCE